jgi:hypothetical protein
MYKKTHKGFHGSKKETHEIHGGEKHRVPDEITVGAFPGKTATRVKPKEVTEAFEHGHGGKTKMGKPYSEE